MSTYRWILTAAGIAQKAIAEAGGARVAPAVFAVGDSNGVDHQPEDMVAGLIHEVWSGPINNIYVSPVDNTLVVVEALIPESAGGFDIREAGIRDAAGNLIAVANYPLTTKPASGSGGAKEIYVRGGFRISNGGDTVLQIAASLVMATKDYVDAHALLTNPHSSTALPTANRLMLRDANGRCQVAAPAAAGDIARKNEVDVHANAPSPHTGHVNVVDYTGMTILAKLSTVDGWGSGLDADKLAGFHPSQNPTANYVPVMGPDGVLRPWGGIYPELNPVAATNLPTTYPDGISMFCATADSSWPSDTGIVMTIKNTANGTVIQYFYADTGSVVNVNPIYSRMASHSANVWSAWVTLVTSAAQSVFYANYWTVGTNLSATDVFTNNPAFTISVERLSTGLYRVHSSPAFPRMPMISMTSWDQRYVQSSQIVSLGPAQSDISFFKAHESGGSDMPGTLFDPSTFSLSVTF